MQNIIERSLIKSTNESALANSIQAVALTAHKYVLRYKNSLQRVSFEGSHISMDGVALCRGRSVVRRRTELLPSFCPKATSFNILARSSCSHPSSPFPRFLPSFFPLPSISSPLRGETLIQFHLACADKLTSLSFFLSLFSLFSFLSSNFPFAVASLLPAEDYL